MQFICNQCDIRMLSQGANTPEKGYMEIKFLCPKCKNICKFIANPGEAGLIKAFNNWEKGQELHKTIYELVTENLSHEITQIIPSEKSTHPDLIEDENWQKEKINWIKIDPSKHQPQTNTEKKIGKFSIGRFPITQAQWIHIMGINTLKDKLNQNKPKLNTPMVNISWNDTQEFIKTLNSLSPKHQFRLPTEKEWEYTCRANSKSIWSFGDNRNEIPKFAWYIDSNSTIGNQTPTKLGLKPPNAWGVHDMLGNIFEWCQDLYSTKNFNDNLDGKKLLNSDTKKISARVVRGGYFRYFPGSTRSDSRSARLSTDKQPSIGFRLVKTL